MLFSDAMQATQSLKILSLKKKKHAEYLERLICNVEMQHGVPTCSPLHDYTESIAKD